MLGAPSTLLRGENAGRVDLGLEACEERGTGGGGRLPRIVLSVHRVGREPSTQGALGGGEALLLAVVWARPSYLGCLAPVQVASARGRCLESPPLCADSSVPSTADIYCRLLSVI